MESGYSNQYSRRLRVFLCHSSGDKPSVRKLYHRLVADGFDPWLDEENLIAGQQWQKEIPKAVRSSDVVVVCLSRNSITKAGYVQKEIKSALDVADEQPEDTIFLIPLKLEECDIPERLSWLQWIDYFEERGHERLIKALKHRANSLGVNIENAPTIPGIVLTKDHDQSVTTPDKNDAIHDKASTAQIDTNAHKGKKETYGTKRDRQPGFPEKQELAPIASGPSLLNSSLSDQIDNDKAKESDKGVVAKTNLQKQGGQTEATSGLVSKQPSAILKTRAKPIIVVVGVLAVLVAGALFLQKIATTNNSTLAGNVALSPSPPGVASNETNTAAAGLNQNSQPAPSPSPPLNSVTVRMKFSRYVGSAGEMPFKREAVTVNAGGQSFTERTSSKGMVSFSNMPCGSTITISVIANYLGENKRHSKTLRLNCSEAVVDLGKFYVYDNPMADGRLHNDAFGPP